MGLTVSLPREGAQKAHAGLSSLLLLVQRAQSFVLVIWGELGLLQEGLTLGVNSSGGAAAAPSCRALRAQLAHLGLLSWVLWFVSLRKTPELLLLYLSHQICPAGNRRIGWEREEA